MYLTEFILNNLKIHINDTCSISTFWNMYLSNGHFLYPFDIVYSLRSFLLKWQKTLSWCKIMKYYASCVSLHVPDCTNKGLQEVGDFFCEKIGSIYFVYLHVNESKKWESDNFLYLYASACLDSWKIFLLSFTTLASKRNFF